MTIEEIISGAVCYQCKIPTGYQGAALIFLASQIVAGGGGGSGTNNLSGSGSPVGVVTPDYVGQSYTDLTTPGFWTSTGATSANWLQIA